MRVCVCVCVTEMNYLKYIHKKDCIYIKSK